MAYPNSSDVASGQPTASAHYNNLRKDAVYLGNVSADSVSLGSFLQSFVLNISIEYLATAKLRVPFDSQKPATVMISGCMLVQTGNIDLATAISGAASVWYIFANRAAGVTSFTITVNTSPVPGADQRLIGECYWNGTAIAAASILSYSQGGDIRAPDYDSGWFAVAYNNTYVKAHNLSQYPREFALYWSAASDDSTAWYRVYEVYSSQAYCNLYADDDNVYAKTGTASGSGCINNTAVSSGGGYYRMLAWV